MRSDQGKYKNLQCFSLSYTLQCSPQNNNKVRRRRQSTLFFLREFSIISVRKNHMVFVCARRTSLLRIWRNCWIAAENFHWKGVEDSESWKKFSNLLAKRRHDTTKNGEKKAKRGRKLSFSIFRIPWLSEKLSVTSESNWIPQDKSEMWS